MMTNRGAFFEPSRCPKNQKVDFELGMGGVTAHPTRQCTAEKKKEKSDTLKINF